MMPAKPLMNMSLPFLSEPQRHVTFEEIDDVDEQGVPNGVDTVEWHAMSDERRAQFMRDKRKQEAFKTEMCKGFIRTGYCRYGAECRFAHFQEELRVRPKTGGSRNPCLKAQAEFKVQAVHPKYKTELCLNFSTRGECGYGSRCQFIHRSPEQSTRLRTASDAGTNSGVYNNSYTAGSFHDNLRLRLNSEGGVKATDPPNRFAVSAFNPRERNALSSTNNYVEAFRRLICGNRRDEGDAGLITSKENGLKKSNIESEPFNSLSFDQWNPFSSLHLFNKNQDTVGQKVSSRSDYISSTNSAASNNGSGGSGYNSSCYDNGCSTDSSEVPNRFAFSACQPRERISLLNASGASKPLQKDFCDAVAENEAALQNCLKLDGVENNSISSFLYEQWNPYSRRRLFDGVSDAQTPAFLQSLNTGASCHESLISAPKNVPLFSADFSSSCSPFFGVPPTHHQTFLSS